MEEYDMAYSEKVVDHYSNPRNVGTLDKSSSEVGTGLVGAPECGDVMRLQIKVNPITHCSVLAEDAIRAAIGDWKTKNGVAETAEVATVNA
jgi:NifU-like protein involved in Fe-S cluster formation